MATREEFEIATEKSTGLKVKLIRETPLEILRHIFETRNKKPMDFSSAFPIIGRIGNLPKLLSREEINAMVDEANRG